MIKKVSLVGEILEIIYINYLDPELETEIRSELKDTGYLIYFDSRVTMKFSFYLWFEYNKRLFCQI